MEDGTPRASRPSAAPSSPMPMQANSTSNAAAVVTPNSNACDKQSALSDNLLAIDPHTAPTRGIQLMKLLVMVDFWFTGTFLSLAVRVWLLSGMKGVNATIMPCGKRIRIWQEALDNFIKPRYGLPYKNAETGQRLYREGDTRYAAFLHSTIRHTDPASNTVTYEQFIDLPVKVKMNFVSPDNIAGNKFLFFKRNAEGQAHLHLIQEETFTVAGNNNGGRASNSHPPAQISVVSNSVIDDMTAEFSAISSPSATPSRRSLRSWHGNASRNLFDNVSLADMSLASLTGQSLRNSSSSRAGMPPPPRRPPRPLRFPIDNNHQQQQQQQRPVLNVIDPQSSNQTSLNMNTGQDRSLSFCQQQSVEPIATGLAASGLAAQVAATAIARAAARHNQDAETARVVEDDGTISHPVYHVRTNGKRLRGVHEGDNEQNEEEEEYYEEEVE